MLIERNMPQQAVMSLKAGDKFLNEEVVYVQQVGSIISIITVYDRLYTAHLKNGACTVFRVAKHNRRIEKRRIEAREKGLFRVPPPEEEFKLPDYLKELD